jgi:hypothetical protein
MIAMKRGAIQMDSFALAALFSLIGMRDKPRPSGRGRIARTPKACLVNRGYCGVFCCAMY